MNRTFLLGVALACACAAPASDSIDEPVPQVGGKGDYPTGNGTIVSTGNANAQLLGGFHYLYDKTTSSQCVASADNAQGPSFLVGDVQRKFHMRHVASRSELARELGIDIGLKVKYPPASVDASFGMLNSFSSSTNSASFLMTIAEEYHVTNKHPLRLTDDAVGALTTSPDAFIDKCGVHFINSVLYSSNVFLLITYTANSEQTASDIKAKLGASVGYGPGKVDVNAAVNVANASANDGVSVTVSLVGRGYRVDDRASIENTIQTLLTSAAGEDTDEGKAQAAQLVGEETYAIIDKIRVEMEDSVARDICRDAGVGKCADGSDAPGYHDNTKRAAKPTGVYLGFYDGLVPTDIGQQFENGELTDPFELARDKLTAVERFIKDYAELEERMTDVYGNEVNLFLRTPSAYKGHFNVAPPADPKLDTASLLATADAWQDLYYPNTPTQIGWHVEEAVHAARDCWEKASLDIEHECTDDDVRATETEQWKDLLVSLETYRDEGRILPVRFVVGAAVATQATAKDVCRDLDYMGLPVRLPTREEVLYLAPAVREGVINWTGRENHEVWYAQDEVGNPRCADKPDTPEPFYENTPQTGSRYMCAGKARLVQTVCVPTTGPFPLLQSP